MFGLSGSGVGDCGAGHARGARPLQRGDHPPAGSLRCRRPDRRSSRANRRPRPSGRRDEPPRVARSNCRGSRGSEDISDKVRDATAPVTAELAELSTLFHQARRDRGGPRDQAGRRRGEGRSTSACVVAKARAANAAAHRTDLGADARGARRRHPRRRRCGRIDLYMQPILTLPQRKVRYYQAVSSAAHRGRRYRSSRRISRRSPRRRR